MTEKLYYKDSYIFKFEAKVLSCTAVNDNFDIILDKTAFFPEGGGQYADKGFIDGVEINDVQSVDEIIHHYSKEAVEIGKTVLCKVDEKRRFRNMQSHSGEHIFSGIIHSLFGLDNISFHLGEDYILVDYNGILTREEILKAEKLSNEIVYRNLPINTYFPNNDELKTFSYRSKLDLKENVRLVEIPGVDVCACCAPHVKNTGEIGLIKVIGTTLQNRHIRITMLFGAQALDYCNMLWDNIEKISNDLSTKPENTYEVFDKAMKDFAACRFKANQLNKKCAVAEAEKIEPTGENLCYFADDADMDTLRLIVNKLAVKVNGITVALSGSDKNGYKFIAASQKANMKEAANSIKTALNAKCGGSEIMIQGSINSTKDKITEYFLS